MRIIIAGSRSFGDYELLKQEVDNFLKRYNCTNVTIVSGTARGADRLGERYAKERGYKIEKYPAQWNVYEKKAGYLRNKQMAQVADAYICFWNGKSKGTKIMIDLAKQYNLILHIVLF